MPRALRTAALVPLVAAVLAVAGCSSTVAGTAHPLGAGPPAGAPAATDDPVAWADRACAAVLPALRISAESPEVSATDLDSSHEALQQHLREVAAAAGRGLAELDGVGPAPTPHGDELVAAFRGLLTGFQRLSPDAPPRTGPPAPPAPNPFTVLSADPALAAAVRDAQSCQAFAAPSSTR
jgi:hypothetical protein